MTKEYRIGDNPPLHLCPNCHKWQHLERHEYCKGCGYSFLTKRVNEAIGFNMTPTIIYHEVKKIDKSLEVLRKNGMPDLQIKILYSMEVNEVSDIDVITERLYVNNKSWYSHIYNMQKALKVLDSKGYIENIEGNKWRRIK